MGCGVTDISSCGKDLVKNLVVDPVSSAAGDAAGSVADSALDRFGHAVATGVGDAVKGLATQWVQVPVPKLDESGTAYWLVEHLWWYMAAAAVLSLMVAGARVAWSARGGEPLREALRSLMTLALVSGGSLAVVNLLLSAGDAYSSWILAVSGGPDFGARILAMMSVLVGNGVGVILVIVLGLLVIVSSLVQTVLMVARSAMLVVLAGMWPLSASATNTDWGRNWFKKTTGWIVAFILYKPAAATIYAAAIQMFGNEKGLLGALMGLTAMALALFALPALMKLCVPLVGGLAGGGGAGVAVGAAALGSLGGAALQGSQASGPTGAAPVPSLGAGSQGGSSGGRGQGGGVGQSGPGGASPTGPGQAAPVAARAVASSSQAGAAGSAAGGVAGAGGAAAGAGPVGLAAAGALEVASAGASGARRVAQDTTGTDDGSS